MDASGRALAVDFGIGVAAVAFATLTRGTPRSAAGLAIGALGCGVLVAVLWVAEHTDVLRFVDRNRPISLVFAAAAFTGVGVAIVVGQGVVAVPAATLLWGMGAGLVGYRGWFGLREPVPRKRRKQAELWGEPPDPEDRRGRE
jgi:hypothetical protein